MNTNRTETERQLIALTQKFLEESGENSREIASSTSLQRHLAIDSLGRAELFKRIEKQFGITLPDRLLAEVDTLAEIATHITQSGSRSTEQSAQKSAVHTEISQVDPSLTTSLTEVLQLYAAKSKDRVHIYFQNEEGQQETLTYGQLYEKALLIAQAIVSRGIHPGETVAIMQPTQLGFFYTFFGVLLAGCIPVPIYPPFRPHLLELYAKQEAKILQNAEVRMLVTFQEAETLSKLLRAFVPSLKEITTVNELLRTKPQSFTPVQPPNDYAFIQYTSGSTNAPKGVLLSHGNLLANIRAYGKNIQMSPQDVVVSWLPLYHDFGLIAAWLGSLYTGNPLVLMTPFSFLNRPERWLWTIHHHRGTISGGPNFAYELCVKKIDPELLAGLDLSSWRLAANGAEAIYPKTIENFANKFAPYGLRREIILPAYGLAESTVGLAIPPLNRAPRFDHVSRKSFEQDKQAVSLSSPEQKDQLTFVSCGMPLPGHQIRIVDEQGQVLPERHIGNLQFTGPSSMQGYFNNPTATAAIYHDGWWESGDLAYQAEGEVFITGRKKDLIIKTGRNLYPAEIEEAVGNIAGIRQGCVAAFGTGDAELGTEKLIVVAETREKDKNKRQQLRTQINETLSTLLDIVPNEVILVPPHTVPKTSSGKLQRSSCKIAYQEGRLTRHVPPWLQVMKLGSRWSVLKTSNTLASVGRGIFTAYICILIAITTLPIWALIQFLSRDHAAKLCKGWLKLLHTLAFCPITLNGSEHAHKSPVIYASNHMSYVDPIFLLSVLPSDTRIVAKKEVMSFPIIRTFMRRLGYLSVDRIDFSQSVEDSKTIEKVLQEGHSIMIFPEGTFSYAAGLRPFKSGAFKVAAETHVPVCPIALQGTRYILRGDEWLFKPGKVTVTISAPIAARGKEWQDVTALKNQVREEINKHCGEPSLDFITPTQHGETKPTGSGL